LDEDTNRALRRFLRRHGITGSGLVEAFARAMLRNPRWAKEIIDSAREIDDERRSRQPD